MSQFVNLCNRDFKVEGSLTRIAHIDGEKYRFLDDPVPIIEALKQTDTRIDLFTFMQRLPETTPKYHYPYVWDNFAALPVSTYDHWWNDQIRSYPRNRARQAEKRGVTLCETPFNEELIKGIWEIYNETPVRQGKKFPHYGMSIEQVRKHAGTFLDQSVFIGAYFEDRLIGFVKLTMDETRTQAGLMHILSLVRQRDKAPTNALIAQAVRSCSERNIAYLVYSNFAYGKKQNDSLSNFKENNGFVRVNIPRYYVPLTVWGGIAYRLGLYHRPTDLVPEFIMSKYRGLRSAWYSS